MLLIIAVPFVHSYDAPLRLSQSQNAASQSSHAINILGGAQSTFHYGTNHQPSTQLNYDPPQPSSNTTNDMFHDNNQQVHVNDPPPLNFNQDGVLRVSESLDPATANWQMVCNNWRNLAADKEQRITQLKTALNNQCLQSQHAIKARIQRIEELNTTLGNVYLQFREQKTRAEAKDQEILKLRADVQFYKDFLNNGYKHVQFTDQGPPQIPTSSNNRVQESPETNVQSSGKKKNIKACEGSGGENGGRKRQKRIKSEPQDSSNNNTHSLSAHDRPLE